MLPARAESPFSILCSRPFRIADIDDSDVILIFGSDLLREHPNEYLRVRKAAANGAARVFVANPYATRTADVAELEVTYTPGKDESLINGLCHAALEDGLADSVMAGALDGKLKSASLAEAADECGLDPQQLRSIATALTGGRKVTVIIGELVTRSRGREAIAAAIANLNRLLDIESRGQLAVLARYANSMGAQRLGLSPAPPDNVIEAMKQMWGQFPDAEPKTTDAMLVQAKKEEISGFFILGTNPLMLYPDLEFVREALERLDFLVVADLFETEATAIADVVLPLSSWAEQDGEYVNLEGTVQPSKAAIRPLHQSRPGLEIVLKVAEKMGQKLFDSPEECYSEIERLLKLDHISSWPSEFLEVKTVEDETAEEYPYPIYLCDDPHHSDYRTEKSTSLANFAGEPYLEISAALAGEFNLEEGNSVRIESPYGKIIVPVRISEYIKNDVLLVPRNFSSVQVTSLFMRKLRVDRVKLSRVDE
jgi:NADH-quinone oxidoreductase subunit G